MNKLINRRGFLAKSALTSSALVIGTFSNRVFAQEKHLRAGLVGWSVVNTLDPAKASQVLFPISLLFGRYSIRL